MVYLKFLGNTWAGLAEEFGISVSFTVIMLILSAQFGEFDGRTEWDVIIMAALFFVIGEGIIRPFRWAIVYNAPIYLYFLYFPAFMGFIIGVLTLKNNRDTVSIAVSVFLISLSGIYFLIMHLKRDLIRERSPSGARLQILKMNMSIGERLTLVFPDRYVEYLRTGDKKYLNKK